MSSFWEKYFKLRKQSVFVLLILIMILATVYVRHIPGQPQFVRPKVALVLPGSAQEAGWNKAHNAGFAAASEALNAEFFVYQNATTGNAVAVGEHSTASQNQATVGDTSATSVNAAILQGASVVFIAVNDFSSELEAIIKQHPEVQFYSVNPGFAAKNLCGYGSRLYQARYLSGIAAAKSSKTGRLGYVAPFSKGLVTAEINAFTMGARSVNPSATVYVFYTGSWNAADSEKNAVRSLVKYADCDVIAYHNSTFAVPTAAEGLGVLYIGYEQNINSFEGSCIASVSTNWQKVYESLIADGLKKTHEETDFVLFGHDEGFVRIELGKNVKDSVSSTIEEAAKKIDDGTDVFTGTIYASNGTILCGQNQTLPDSALLSGMNLVRGTVIYEK